MFVSSFFNRLTASLSTLQLPAIRIDTAGIINRVQAIAMHIFQKLTHVFHASENIPSQSGAKSFALLASISLIILLFLSAIQKRGSSIVPPPTPFPDKK